MDLRIDQIFHEQTKGDTSFMEKESFLSLFFGGTKYSQKDMRDAWRKGIRHGIEIGLRKASVEGQKVELTHNTTNEKHKEFLEKFYQLAHEYKCAVQYHPKLGMTIRDLK